METILLEIIAGSIIIYYELKTINKIERIKLVKQNKYQNFKVIDKAPILKLTKTNKQSNIKNNPKLEEIISTFLNRLRLYITEEEIQIAKNNLRTLKYKEGNPLFLLLPYWGGYYQAKKHYIAVSKSKNIDEETFEHIIHHELLHAVTSYHTKSNYYMGFWQINTKRNKDIGKMINEGYTELLTRRMFGYNKRAGYNYEVAIAELVEFIVGKEKMEKLYFSLDLDGLINELSKYQEINKVKQFILDLDTIHSLYKKSNENDVRKMLLDLYNKNSIFLYEAFKNKMKQTININNISDYEHLSKRFLQLFDETTKYTAFISEKRKKDIKEIEKEETLAEKEYLKAKRQFNKEEKTLYKKLVRKPTNRKGFINILTITTILTFISLLSIGISYLLLQAR